jgi:hypothetical protein
MPQLELSPEGGVYVKEWLWKFHYKETDTEKKDVALPDDEKVSPTKLPAECQPGTFKAGDDSCDVKHDYDVEVYGNSEPGNEKVELHWDSSNRVDLGTEKAPPDPSEMVSRPDDDQQP